MPEQVDNNSPPPGDGETQHPKSKAHDGAIVVAVKAVGDWELDVLAVPYGGPNKGKDSHA